jgi:peptide/nickel transport system substrate-binding protein
VLNPALHPLLRANGQSVWFGWPEDAALEGLRDQWIATADGLRQKELAAAIERRAFEVVPYVPAGLVQQPMAFRRNLTGMVLSPVQLFWNIEKRA